MLPGSRRGIIARMLPYFAATARLLAGSAQGPQIIMPAVPERLVELKAATADWPSPPLFVTAEADKFAAFKLARAALASSGTVTLELAVAGTPMIVAYKVEPWVAPILRRMITAKMAAYANLVLGEAAFPEFIQQDCKPANLAGGLAAIMADGDPRDHQLAALARIPAILGRAGGSPSVIAADCVLQAAVQGRALDFARTS